LQGVKQNPPTLLGVTLLENLILERAQFRHKMDKIPSQTKLATEFVTTQKTWQKLASLTFCEGFLHPSLIAMTYFSSQMLLIRHKLVSENITLKHIFRR
jgi:hypothetical protein